MDSTAPTYEWYNPSPNDVLKKVETYAATSDDILRVQPTTIPQVSLGKETEYRTIPKWENVTIDSLELPVTQTNPITFIDNTTKTNIDNLWGGSEREQLEISPLEEGGKVHGDKLKSDWENAQNMRNTRDWRELSLEPAAESCKFHGDKLFDSTANSRPVESERAELFTETNVNNEMVNTEEDLAVEQYGLDYPKNDQLSSLRSNSVLLDDQTWSPSLNLRDESSWTDSSLKAQLSSQENVDKSKVEFAFVSDLHRLEEEEREDRIKRGVCPILLGKHHKFQHELLHHHKQFTNQLAAPISIAPVLPTLETIQSTTSSIKEKTLTWSSYLKENVLLSTKTLVDTAKDTLGMYNISSLKSEERERSRKMKEKVDPMFDARKRRVEEELLTSIKIAK